MAKTTTAATIMTSIFLLFGGASAPSPSGLSDTTSSFHQI
jgi:hypothetical protein